MKRLFILMLFLLLVLLAISCNTANAPSSKSHPNNNTSTSTLDTSQSHPAQTPIVTSKGSPGDITMESASVSFEYELIRDSILLSNKVIENASERNLRAASIPAELFGPAKTYSNLKGINPDSVIVLSFSSDTMEAMIDNALAAENSLTQDEQAQMRNNYLHLIARILNGKYGGYSFFDAMTFLEHSDSFQIPDDSAFTGYSLVVLVYSDYSDENYSEEENLTAVNFVSFIESNNNTMTAASSFVYNYDRLISSELSNDEDNIRIILNEVLETSISSTGLSISKYEGIRLQSLLEK